MSNALRFLEDMGSNPAIGRMSPSAYAAAVAKLDIDAALRQALVARDHDSLNDLLGGRGKMMCMIWQPEQEPERKEDQEEREAPDEGAPSPDKD